MKRGLVEVAERPVYEERLAKLQAELREQGIAVLLLYGDVYRSDDIAFLTNLCIYWNEGVIAVPADRPPALLAKLSARVHGWMRRTSVLEDLRASQNLPKLISEYLTELPEGMVAFSDPRWWPTLLLEDLSAAAGDRGTVMLEDAVRKQRLVVDEADRKDLVRAGAVIAAALMAVNGAGGSVPTELLASAELSARGAGARDVLAFCRQRADGAITFELTVQFANVWAYAARTLSADGGSIAALTSAYAAAQEALAPGVTPAQLAAAAGSTELELTVVHHCDLGSGGDYRPVTDTQEPLNAGSVVALSVRTNGAEPVVLGDTFLLTDSGAMALTATTEVEL